MYVSLPWYDTNTGEFIDPWDLTVAEPFDPETRELSAAARRVPTERGIVAFEQAPAEARAAFVDGMRPLIEAGKKLLATVHRIEARIRRDSQGARRDDHR